jgi:hypothetical protein
MLVFRYCDEHLTLQAFKEEPLSLELIEEVSVDHEDRVVEDVAEGGANDQDLTAMTIRPWTSEE